jgi:glycosyltransferase involved in cell wall biosynthesis
MLIALIFFLLALTGTFEFLVHVIRARHAMVRIITAGFAVAVIASCTLVMLMYTVNLFSILITVIQVYRIFNLFRLVRGQMHERHMWDATFNTGLWLVGSALVLAGLWAVWDQRIITAFAAAAALMLLQLLVAIVFYKNVRGHVARMQAANNIEVAHEADLPSLTVAIPARNETDTLEQCIRSLLASHYPKLEILVLDDCSQTTRTPEIIREFAHDGVRFIKGEEPRDNWLAKNQAYEALAEAASGELILFCGVDIRLEAGSLRRMVAYAVNKRKKMVCVMPHNVRDHGNYPLIQPMRYVWELALPRRIFKRPPVLSSCWLISKAALKKAGGFRAVPNMVVPEAHFAKTQLAGDGYAFLASGTTFGITSVKTVAAQRETAIRVAYPQIHRRPEIVALVTLGYILWVGLPLSILLSAVLARHFDVLLVAAVVVIALSAMFYRALLQLAYSHASPAHTASLPAAALVYVVLMNYSMYKYEFSEVLWKGRNVCLPVMQVIPRLPKI